MPEYIIASAAFRVLGSMMINTTPKPSVELLYFLNDVVSRRSYRRYLWEEGGFAYREKLLEEKPQRKGQVRQLCQPKQEVAM